MTLRLVAGRRRFLATALLTTLTATITGCSHARTQPMRSASASGAPATTSPAAVQPAADGSAEGARLKALTITKALRSYAFSSTAVLGADRTTVHGHANAPANLDYTITKGATQEEVLRISGNSYVRIVPGPWKRLAHPSPASPPLQGLLSALTAARDMHLDSTRTRLTATITGHDAAAAGLIKASNLAAEIPVTFTLDPAGHVSSFSLSTTLNTGTNTVRLEEQTTYSAFNTAPAITTP